MPRINNFSKRVGVALVFMLGAAAPLESGAKPIYRVVTPDGRVLFTDAKPAAPAPRAARAARAGSWVGVAGPVEQRPYHAEIAHASREHGLDAALVHAVVTVESNYNVVAVSRAGATGLMQLMPGTAQRFGVTRMRDANDNLAGGARYLRELLTMFNGDLRLALAAYNAGEEAVMRFGMRIPPYRETQAYVPKVIAVYRALRRQSSVTNLAAAEVEPVLEALR